ncbi:uncharacterized protein DNG_07393 [Cephalotrichum gorgonifer]|uniref:Methyltransferase type 12 domain-containing protein n=1 Tax=Cephalotrichum gorgonifer TaxID=2041049 RepID=A0AAE8SXE5_9PEZI|nr:uncharacterized protein DNG_07393 [Cephalotrichum gorgonifer]
MASVSGEAELDASTYWIAPSRNFRTSARLHLQHLLFQNTLEGILLEDRINDSLPSGTEITVGDLGCGNGVWLSDLNHRLSAAKPEATLQLHGFDINPLYFPAPQFLSKSITLKNLDVLARPLPADLQGTFDVVHVRAFSSIIRNGDVSPLLTSALDLLKPGGWLQWEETLVANFSATAPSPDVSKQACDTIIHILDAGGRANGLEFEFLNSLDEHFAGNGFVDVEVRKIDKRASDLKAWTEDYLMVWEELAVMFPSRKQVPQSPMTKEGFQELFAKAVAETEAGVVVHQGKLVIASGRKPL